MSTRSTFASRSTTAAHDARTRDRRLGQCLLGVRVLGFRAQRPKGIATGINWGLRSKIGMQRDFGRMSVLHTERRRRAGRHGRHGASRAPAQMGGAHPSLCRCGSGSEAQSPGADVGQLGSGGCLPCATHGIRPPTWRSRAHRRRQTRPDAATSLGVRRSGRSVGVAVGLRRRRCR